MKRPSNSPIIHVQRNLNQKVVLTEVLFLTSDVTLLLSRQTSIDENFLNCHLNITTTILRDRQITTYFDNSPDYALWYGGSEMKRDFPKSEKWPPTSALNTPRTRNQSRSWSSTLKRLTAALTKSEAR